MPDRILVSHAGTLPRPPGLKEQLASYEKFKQDEDKQEQILAELPNIERYRKPWDGLQMLNGIEPTPHLAPQFTAARARLEDLLARLDKDPPKMQALVPQDVPSKGQHPSDAGTAIQIP